MFEEITAFGVVMGWRLNGFNFWESHGWKINRDYYVMIRYAEMSDVMGHGL